MSAEIVLPAGTAKVMVLNIPELFAKAICPELPVNTPSRITALRKLPLTKANIHDWCGDEGRVFAVPLTDDEFTKLKSGIWKHLPELQLPIDEAEFTPYWEAYKRKRQPSWKLEVGISNASTNQGMRYAIVAEEYEKTINDAIMNVELVPRSRDTLLPMPGAMGDMLTNCFVTVADLTTFAARFDISVKIAEATQPAFVLNDKIIDSHYLIHQMPVQTAPVVSKSQSAAAEQTHTADATVGEDGLSRREKQIRAIEAIADGLGFTRLAIRDGEKKKIEVICKKQYPQLFGVGPDPFKRAWQEAVTQRRMRMQQHAKYARR